MQVEDGDMQRVGKATGAKVQTTTNNMDPSVLGTCSRFEEKQVGQARGTAGGAISNLVALPCVSLWWSGG